MATIGEIGGYAGRLGDTRGQLGHAGRLGDTWAVSGKQGKLGEPRGDCGIRGETGDLREDRGFAGSSGICGDTQRGIQRRRTESAKKAYSREQRRMADNASSRQ